MGKFLVWENFRPSPSTQKIKQVEDFIKQINGVSSFCQVVIATKIKPDETFNSRNILPPKFLIYSDLYPVNEQNSNGPPAHMHREPFLLWETWGLSGVALQCLNHKGALSTMLLSRLSYNYSITQQHFSQRIMKKLMSIPNAWLNVMLESKPPPPKKKNAPIQTSLKKIICSKQTNMFMFILKLMHSTYNHCSSRSHIYKGFDTGIKVVFC